ncbi:class I SAM-dependent methyltransferase [Azospirillum sp. ST 5-10]|uniref:class I SAM-dependent methyltransferase n=1 Tax=unclassified Azospirillum TaxID=2630922 RepID=UPI003F4A2315
MTRRQRQDHWQGVYSRTASDAVSWHQDHPAASLALIRASGVAPDTRLVDVGGGASTLVDHLLDRGHRAVTVLDIAGAALAVARTRLGVRADAVSWVEADVTAWRPPARYGLWHDRAVFHFLTEAADRDAYRAALDAALEPGGTLVIASFAPDGPDRCSGLPVVRYGPETLAAELGAAYRLEEVVHDDHRTPAGRRQAFVHCRFRRSPADGGR